MESRLFHGVYGDIPDGQDTVDASGDCASKRNLRVLSATRQVRIHVAYRSLTLGPSLH